MPPEQGAAMIGIFDQYAQQAFQTGEGMKNPPRPIKPLKQVKEILPETNIPEVVDHFIICHKIPHHLFPEAREQFEKLYDVGVFQFEADIYEEIPATAIVFLRLLAWDGARYADVNELLDLSTFEEDDDDDCEV